MIESGLDHIRILEDNDFQEYKISCKASDVFLAAAAYQGLADATDAPIHLGITEAGGLVSGTIKSAIGLGNLLWMGIGDTIRVSLSADPVEEVKVGYEILKSLGLRHRGVNIRRGADDRCGLYRRWRGVRHDLHGGQAGP